MQGRGRGDEGGSERGGVAVGTVVAVHVSVPEGSFRSKDGRGTEGKDRDTGHVVAGGLGAAKPLDTAGEGRAPLVPGSYWGPRGEGEGVA